VNVATYRESAIRNLPRAVFDHLDGGVEDESTMAENRAGLDRIKLVQKVLRYGGDADPSTTVLGTPVSLPVLLAPAGHHGLAHSDGEKATARAAQRADTVMILSSGATYPLEEVRASSPHANLWFQMFFLSDAALTRDILDRATQSGFGAIVITVDTQALGNFERNTALGDQFILAMREGNLEKYQGKFESLIQLFSYRATWSDLERLVAATELPVVVKGIQTAQDASAALAAGAAAIYVSNHGGRQLDSCAATIDSLPAIVSAVRGRAEVFVDGGFRRGTDVVKALALGARAVVVGRPYLFGLAADGTDGVCDVLDIFRREIVRDLRLMGCASVHDLDASWLRNVPTGGNHRREI
jgi:4-hydroxymandelate oxidase